MSEIIKAKNIMRIYERGSEKIYAVNDSSLVIEKGKIVSFIGPSGSGKTTLINVLGCLDNPTSGELVIDGNVVFKEGVDLSEVELTKIRRKYFGYVFQKFFLIPTLTVYENIVLPFAFYKGEDAESNIDEILEMLGIAHRKNHLPSELSGGEMQRVAIARALINNPPILLADEPTGNLDSKRADEIKELFVKLNKERGITIILVTHNHDLADISDKIVEIKDGVIQN